MWDSLIAVAGTLAGVLVTSVLAQRAARAERIETREENRRRERLQVITDLSVALADHRRTMWVREEARLAGAPVERVEATRDESHQTRSALTAPFIQACAVLPPVAADLAGDALLATYALRNAPDLEALSVRREAAVAAADQFIRQAVDVVTGVA